MTHAFYVALAYGVSAAALGGLFVWLWADRGARKRELAELEAGGHRRRSERDS